jgi:hypothetical protein
MKMIVVMMALALSASSFAATSGSLLLKGQVQEVLDIVVTPEAIASTLPLDISQNGTKVATVTEKSNASQGYRVKMVSANLSNLKRAGGSELFPYYITYNDLPVNLIDTQTYSYHNPEAVVASRDIKIFYTGVSAENMVAGEYSDTITFTISAN